MTTTRGSAHYAGLLPVSVRLTTLENESGQPSFRKRASRALSSLIAFCAGVAATFAWWSYGDATGQMIANSSPQLGWLAPRDAATVQKAPDRIAPTASDAPDQGQLDAMLGDDLHAMRLSLDRIVAGQELIARRIDEIVTSIAARRQPMARSTDQTATSVAAGQDYSTTRSSDQTAATITTGQGQIARNTDQTTSRVDQAPSARAGSIDEIVTSIAARQQPMARSTDQTATSVAAGQDSTTRSSDQTAATITTGQGQIARNTDQTTTRVDQAPSARAGSITVKSRGDGASLQATARLNITPTEAKPTQTPPERGKQLAAASGHDASCFPSASAVLQSEPGASPTWTLRAPGHEGTQCWHAAARPSGSDHRSQMVQRNEIVGATANELSAPPAPYTRPRE